jgi:Uma2 family endonuclease
MASPASQRHQQLVSFLDKVLGTFVEQHDLGLVLTAPYQMRLQNGREPDVLFVAKANLGRLQRTYLDGPADLVIEIISPESVGRDRGEKFYEYAQGGVPEYWLIDPETEWAEFYRLEGRHYVLTLAGNQGRFESATIPGFWLEVAWLWQAPLPRVVDTLITLGVIRA